MPEAYVEEGMVLLAGGMGGHGRVGSILIANILYLGDFQPMEFALKAGRKRFL